MRALLLVSLVAACNQSGLPNPADGSAPADLGMPAGDMTPMTCGGFAGRPCPSGMYCETPPGMCCCDIPGTCKPLPGEGCSTEFMPVCGCDGKTYPNDCERQKAGASVDYAGACATPFPCGGMTCQPSQICFQSCSGIGPPPPPQCQPSPPACNGHPTCACIMLGVMQTCQDLPGGGVLVTQNGCA